MIPATNRPARGQGDKCGSLVVVYSGTGDGIVVNVVIGSGPGIRPVVVAVSGGASMPAKNLKELLESMPDSDLSWQNFLSAIMQN